jgi:hypothetical protein
MVKSVLEMELSKPINDFSLSEMVQIFEASQLVVTSFSREVVADMLHLKITFYPGDLQSCLSSLRRYGFEILTVDGRDLTREHLEDHAAYLNTYLNI